MLGPVLIRASGTGTGVFVIEFGQIAIWTNG
jgi:hypothetical protein